MVREVEGTHTIGNTALYTKSWLPDEPSKAKVIFVHGYSDHINRYYELFPTLASRGIEIHGFDQRGWGRSVRKPSEKGLTGPTSQVLSDIASFIKSHLPSSIPVFVMGHSMGGGEVLMLASSPEYEDLMPNIRGWICEAPFIGFPVGFEPNPITVFFGRLAGKFLPHMHMKNQLLPENLTRDPEVAKSLYDDELCHDTGTLEGLAHMLDRTAALSSGKTRLSKGVKSLWICHGTADKGTSFAASKKFFEEQSHIPDREFKAYEGAYHILHADLKESRPVLAKDVGDWILARCDDADPQKAGESKL
ncbi:lysophospholipase-like protein [Xylogone sp. PMI_703]|nr:lysophospholipase-like protein [Xylogone sp. PMI_703]